MKEQRKYVLTIRRGKNNYLPLEWELANNYHGEDLSTLEGIDKFTSSTDIPELFTDLIDKSVIEADETFQGIAIIFYEKGNVREVPYGPVFNDMKDKLNGSNIIDFILSNTSDKQLINKIYNSLNKYQGVEAVDKFRLVLQNLELFSNKGEKYLRMALSEVNNIEYEIVRFLNVYIEAKLRPELEKEITRKKLSRNNDKKAA